MRRTKRNKSNYVIGAGAVIVLVSLTTIALKISSDRALAESDAVLARTEKYVTAVEPETATQPTELIQMTELSEDEEILAETAESYPEQEYEVWQDATAEQEQPISESSIDDIWTNGGADEYTLLCRMVRIELGEGSGDDYYQACYLQTAVALNRVAQGWGGSITEVLMQSGQFYGWGYDTWDWSQISIDCPTLQQAVSDCLAYNDTPSNLVFADSRHNHNGTDNMEFYAEICGQDFYLSR